jgi:hypothetical protein
MNTNRANSKKLNYYFKVHLRYDMPIFSIKDLRRKTNLQLDH